MIMSHERSKVIQIKMRFRRWSYCLSQDCKISATIVYCWLSQWTLRRSEFFKLEHFDLEIGEKRYLTCYVETKHRTKGRIFRRKYVFICENKFLSALFRETKCQKCIPGIYLIIQLEVWNFEILKNFEARQFQELSQGRFYLTLNDSTDFVATNCFSCQRAQLSFFTKRFEILWLKWRISE